MGIEFTSVVVSLQVDLSLINETNNLNVVRSLHELDTLESSRREDTGAIAGLGAPSNLKLLSLSNGGWSTRRSPKTEVCKLVSSSSRVYVRYAPSMEFKWAVWQRELWPSVVELQRL
jgi:hypothetical protein